jgi:hypothetical protein
VQLLWPSGHLFTNRKPQDTKVTKGAREISVVVLMYPAAVPIAWAEARHLQTRPPNDLSSWNMPINPITGFLPYSKGLDTGV